MSRYTLLQVNGSPWHKECHTRHKAGGGGRAPASTGPAAARAPGAARSTKPQAAGAHTTVRTPTTTVRTTKPAAAAGSGRAGGGRGGGRGRSLDARSRGVGGLIAEYGELDL